MKFQITTAIKSFEFPIVHGDPVILMGSCFSDEMSMFLKRGGLNVLSNPFGTLFYPTAIGNVITSALNDSKTIDVFKREEGLVPFLGFRKCVIWYNQKRTGEKGS